MDLHQYLLSMSENYVARNRFLSDLCMSKTQASQADAVYGSEWVHGQFYKAAFHLNGRGRSRKLRVEEVFKDALLAYRGSVKARGCHYSSEKGSAEACFYSVGRLNCLGAARKLTATYFPKRELAIGSLEPLASRPTIKDDLKEFLSVLPVSLAIVARDLLNGISQAEIARRLSVSNATITARKAEIKRLLADYLKSDSGYRSE